jgi:sulfite exporter TauE/SafE/plastocyanin domain-containing protein/copper chaperone CopZ
MADDRATLRLDVDGMTCGNCEQRIEKAVRALPGVRSVRASASLAEVTVRFDPHQVRIEAIREAITGAGYQVRGGESPRAAGAAQGRFGQVLRFLGLLAVVAAVFILVRLAGAGAFLPTVSQTMGYGLIFVVGLITSLHCVAMCGGIAVSQGIGKGGGSCVEEEGSAGRMPPGLLPGILYNAGRVVSYTVIGGVVGAVGSLFSLSTALKGLMPILAGVFMLVLGVRMLGIFPWLSRLRIRLPRFGKGRLSSALAGRGPFLVGLLNGLMPCGPLQTMQVYALGTGSFLAGAFSMFLFSLGTVPLMLGFGAISSLLSARFNRWMLKASAVLVVALGLVMFTRGLNLFGVSLPPMAASRLVELSSDGAGSARSPIAVARVAGAYQTVSTTVDSGQYHPFVVQKGVPVRWTITAKAEDLNGCNNPLTVPSYGIRKQLVPGENLIEFTPKEEGTITYTCWMGMISSEIRVVTDVAAFTPADISLSDPATIEAPPAEAAAAGCCGASSGSGRFAGGRVPTDLIVPARLQDGAQLVDIRVGDDGYNPAVVVLQRGVKAKIRFVPAGLTGCNSVVVFPGYNGSLDLGKGQLETPLLDVQGDFTFQCGMGMLHGYVRVVNDLAAVDVQAVRAVVDSYKAAPTGISSCCGY